MEKVIRKVIEANERLTEKEVKEVKKIDKMIKKEMMKRNKEKLENAKRIKTLFSEVEFFNVLIFLKKYLDEDEMERKKEIKKYKQTFEKIKMLDEKNDGNETMIITVRKDSNKNYHANVKWMGIEEIKGSSLSFCTLEQIAFSYSHPRNDDEFAKKEELVAEIIEEASYLLPEEIKDETIRKSELLKETREEREFEEKIVDFNKEKSKRMIQKIQLKKENTYERKGKTIREFFEDARYEVVEKEFLSKCNMFEEGIELEEEEIKEICKEAFSAAKEKIKHTKKKKTIQRTSVDIITDTLSIERILSNRRKIYVNYIGKSAFNLTDMIYEDGKYRFSTATEAEIVAEFLFNYKYHDLVTKEKRFAKVKSFIDTKEKERKVIEKMKELDYEGEAAIFGFSEKEIAMIYDVIEEYVRWE